MRRVLVLCALAALPSAVLARDYEWNWRLPPEVYRNLEFTCRASVDRATKVFAESYDALRRGTPVPELVPRFRAAAAEWKKVQIQAEAEGFDEQLLAYVIFMQGFARQCAHDRNEAIKLFGEVLDLYPDEKWIARPARYWLGTSKVGMGDVRAGDADIDELLAEAGERPDPIVACALNDRARRLWADGKEKPAIDYLKRVDETFKETNHWTWESANDFLGFAAAFCIGGEAAAAICTFLSKTYYVYLIKASTVTVVLCFALQYCNGNAKWVNPFRRAKDKNAEGK